MLLNKRFKKTYFTLIEILIVITIILSIGSIIGINLIKGKQQQQFYTASRLVADKLQMAQDLMLLLNCDIRVKLEFNSKGILQCHLNVDKPLDPQLKKALNFTTDVSGISSFDFVDHQQITHSNKIELAFFSGGSKMSQGKIVLYSSNLNSNQSSSKAMQQQIILAGFPQSIKIERGDQINTELLKTGVVDLTLFPQEVLEKERERKIRESKNNEQTTSSKKGNKTKKN